MLVTAPLPSTAEVGISVEWGGAFGDVVVAAMELDIDPLCKEQPRSAISGSIGSTGSTARNGSKSPTTGLDVLSGRAEQDANVSVIVEPSALAQALMSAQAWSGECLRRLLSRIHHLNSSFEQNSRFEK